MKIRFVGDVHGKFGQFFHLIETTPNDIDQIIQVGDMGVGFPGSNILGFPDRVKFIRGNHDNPAVCKNFPGWIPDGTFKDDILFIGGACSIDRDHRTEGLDWWEDEELSIQALNNIIDAASVIRPKIIVTHDCPASVVWPMFMKNFFQTRTAQALDSLFEICKPNLWLFGHWHLNRSEIINGTRFICLGELSYIDIDMDNI